MTTLSRRHLLSLMPSLALPLRGYGKPRPAAAEHCFLFVFCNGGWDPSYVFTPYQPLGLEPPTGSAVAEVGGIRFVDTPGQPAVRTFLEGWGAQTCIVNGIEVRSITHERCRRIIMTGTSESGRDDWPTLLAASARSELLCPHLVIGGPSFSSLYTRKIVRIGPAGQLVNLLTGDAFTMSDRTILQPDPGVEALGDAFVRSRAAALAENGGRGREAALAEMYGVALDDGAGLAAVAGDLNLSAEEQGCTNDLASEAAVAFDCFERGFSRCAIIQSGGWCSSGWDTHQNGAQQAEHFQLLFKELAELMTDLDGRGSATSGALADRVTVVVFSEMGRHPVLNSWGGKDHWTYTSAMLLGAGVAGGQVIGGLDSQATGLAIDLASGDLSEGGTDLLPGHLGATLLALGDHDPGDFLPGYDPILGALR